MQRLPPGPPPVKGLFNTLRFFNDVKRVGMLKFFSDYFKIPYPYEKLDLIAVPEYWPGAMENAGLVTFSDKILLIDPQKLHLMHYH